MEQFNIGDEVKCIDNVGFKRYLKTDVVYTVDSRNDSYIGLKGVSIPSTETPFHVRRFILNMDKINEAIEQRTTAILEYFRGRDNEFSELLGLILAGQAMDRAHEASGGDFMTRPSKQLRALFDNVRIARRMDEINASYRAGGK